VCEIPDRPLENCPPRRTRVRRRLKPAPHLMIRCAAGCWIPLAVLLSLPLCAQELRLRVEPGANGRDGAIVAELESPPGKEPLALQWDFSIPPALQLDPPSASVGEASGSVQKSLQCALQVNYSRSKDPSFRCIVAGGLHGIPNGAIAIVKYSAARNAKPGRYQIEIEKALAVTSGVKKAPLKSVKAPIFISK
jgi:hypothetical protein